MPLAGPRRRATGTRRRLAGARWRLAGTSGSSARARHGVTGRLAGALLRFVRGHSNGRPCCWRRWWGAGGGGNFREAPPGRSVQRRRERRLPPNHGGSARRRRRRGRAAGRNKDLVCRFSSTAHVAAQRMWLRLCHWRRTLHVVAVVVVDHLLHRSLHSLSCVMVVHDLCHRPVAALYGLSLQDAVHLRRNASIVDHGLGDGRHRRLWRRRWRLL